MNPVLRVILIVVLFNATALVMGISGSLAVSGVISVMTAALATGAVGALLGLVIYTRPLPKPQDVGVRADAEGGVDFIRAADFAVPHHL
jgi:hypothetical protein